MTTALYRRYRPDTFDEVIGQTHVTEPIKAALRSNRITHAYLFSGPRGCGKTTSARILARCLNCEEGPTDTPCGKCQSCVELANGGSGSLDVVEIDAASHNGVDDARELRERAAFAPVRDRYKVFILDEAHMVTPQGFNALLKLVEEPPEHVKFIFATTEPERVIGTIRSRTHHYPFRLVPGDVLQPYLASLCEAEGIQVGEGVLPLVIRAGGGSVRDSLSVLDQLMAGSIDQTISYELAVALLGYTDASLLDSAVEQLAKRDGAGVFATIEQMVESGHDPRRFVEDFLQRLRDLLIISVAGDRARDILSELPAEQRERMFEQAKEWGAPALSAAANITDAALRTMVGATSPRLQLELMVGRILVELSGASASADAHSQGVPAHGIAGGQAPALPGSAPSGGGGVQALEDDIDNGPAIMGEDGKPLTGAALARERLRRSRAENEPAPAAPQAPSQSGSVQAPRGSNPPSSTELESSREGTREQKPAPTQAQAARTENAQPQREQATTQAQEAANAPVASTPSPSSGASGNVTANLHGKWDEFVEAVRTIMPSSAFLIGDHARLVSEDETTVTFGFANQGLANVFIGKHQETAKKAIQIVTGVAKTPLVQVGGEPVGQPAQASGQTQAPGGAQPQRTQPQQAAQQGGAQQGVHQPGEPQRQHRGYSQPLQNAWGQQGQAQVQREQSTQSAWPEVRQIPNSAPAQPETPANTAPTPANPHTSTQRDDTRAAGLPSNQQTVNPADNHRANASTSATTTPASGSGQSGESLAHAGGASYQAEASQGGGPRSGPAGNEPTGAVPAGGEPSRTHEPRLHAVPSPVEEPAFESIPEPPADPYEPYDDIYDPEGGARMDDADAANSALVGLPLVEKMFGARIIENTSEGK